MSSRAQFAEAFQSKAIARSDRAVRKVLKLWNRVPPGHLDGGWAVIEPELSSTVATAVARNAADSQIMVSRVARADSVAVADRVVPNAFLGIDGSGRTASSLLFGAVTVTKTRIGAGLAPRDALTAGAAYLASMTKTVIADMARTSTATASAGSGYVRYVRVVSPGACSRCAILAGSDRFTKHFERHPACKCTSVPVRSDKDLDDLIASPGEHFNSLSEAEQDHIYGKAGAEAIRLGADPIQVVGARRGASGMRYSRAYPNPPGQIRRMQRVPIGVKPDGSPIMGFVTVEGITKRGNYGRLAGGATVRLPGARYSTVTRSRLMPETIFEMTNDVELRRTLLRDAGYLEPAIRNKGSNDWIADRLTQQHLDRVTADTFYRSIGIDLY